ncbi:hypothetical protein EJ08DRAFT_659806 [Tothia fuscella]|uniref:FAD/NAD(P)-binding domain-containing protein n=1 Tax=Tothia fuscella TaxID=1048955 RepID=A0A9P4NUG2_9PEZI|nr:hypothetical protein EJ08DRAFT_659806 [Tothia fuscella]
MAQGTPQYVDTVIIGGGPSSLILSYILHGHVPYYSKRHHDPLLHARLSKEPNLLKVTPEAYAHFYSSLRYSTQALPLNTLLDTLIRPNADTEINPESCVTWEHEPDKAVSHIVMSSGDRPGGQWIDNPVEASWDIGTLSYSEMLSLPGYTFKEHHWGRTGSALPELQRPSRSEVADYFAVYPKAVGIENVLYTSNSAGNIMRTHDGFLIGSHGIFCKHLVLATGVFTVSIPPPRLLDQLAKFDNPDEPLLVIGSGFSAADVIISAPPTRRILHLYHWAPDKKPSPLRGCHHQAYPEYAGIYRQMKLAAMSSRKSASVSSPMARRKSNPFFARKDWARLYEGFPNAEVIDVKIEAGAAVLRISTEEAEIIERSVGSMAYVVGRRGRLEYLDNSLRKEVLGHTGINEGVTTKGDLISGRTLRSKAEVNLEVASNVFITGSLTGDSLIRHSFGSCVFAASAIMGFRDDKTNRDGCEMTREQSVHEKNQPLPIATNGTGHDDLHIDRKSKPTRVVVGAV